MYQWAWWLKPNTTTNTEIYSNPDCGICPYSPYNLPSLLKEEPVDDEQDKN